VTSNSNLVVTEDVVYFRCFAHEPQFENLFSFRPSKIHSADNPF